MTLFELRPSPRHGPRPQFDHAIWPLSAFIDELGRHCGAGEEIARDVELPTDIHPGDLLAVACTGAYHYSMGAACNLVGRPPLIAVADGRPRPLVRRETIADLLARDCDWSHPSHRSGSVTMVIDKARGNRHV